MKLYLAPFILFCAIAVTAAEADTLIRVRPHVVVSPGAEVKIMQLVDAQGLSAEAEKTLISTAIVTAPAHGERQELLPASLMGVLRPIVQAERARARGAVHLLLPKKVVIDTVKRELNQDLVWEELRQVWQPLCADCQLDVEALSLPAIQGVRDWSLKIKPEMPRGSFAVPMTITRADTAVVNAWISGRLVIKRKVPVAKRAIASGERIEPGAFGWELRDTTYATDGAPAEASLPGQRLKQGLRAGDVIWQAMLEREKAVRRGDRVQVKSGDGAWEISMTMVAQQDAMVGDVINLKNPKTNNHLMGLVTGHGEVELR